MKVTKFLLTRVVLPFVVGYVIALAVVHAEESAKILVKVIAQGPKDDQVGVLSATDGENGAVVLELYFCGTILEMTIPESLAKAGSPVIDQTGQDLIDLYCK